MRKSSRIKRKGSEVSAPPKGFIVRSAESSRMTGLRSMPVSQRQAAIDRMLAKAR